MPQPVVTIAVILELVSAARCPLECRQMGG